jgi:hypothetical protein
VALFSLHPLLLETAYSDLKRLSSEQSTILVGTPGSVSTREVNGRPFLYRQFYDAQGKKRSDYLGAAGDAEAEARATATRAAIENTSELLSRARLLARQGYVRVDTKSGAVIAAVANRGLFRAGAILVGSHAYGVLLNELGARAASFATSDVDLARSERLAMDGNLASMLEESHLPLTPVLSLDRRSKPTSFKAPGREGLRVDLLVPTAESEMGVRAVPELEAHATAVPHLSYVLQQPMDAIVLGREAVPPVRVPRPERFAWHKMLVSQLRTSTSDKRTKDVHQAAVIFAVLAEKEPDALEEGWSATRHKTKTRAGALKVRALLSAEGHERAVDLLDELTAR